MKNFKPLGDKVVVKVSKAESITKSGIHIPDASIDGKVHSKGEIIEVGTGSILPDGTRKPIDVNIGDIVFFAQYAGHELEQTSEEKTENEGLAFYIVDMESVHGKFVSNE